MAEEFSFFNSVAGDRQYEADEFAKYFREFLTTGLYHKNNAPALRVVHTSLLKTRIESGSAYIEGYMYRNTTNLELTHAAADPTNPRIDRVVLRLDRSAGVRSVRATIKKGTPASSPIAPSLQRDAVVYEISLAQVRINAGASTVTSVTDERFNESVCGLVSSLITVPTSTFEAEWRAWFDNVQNQTGARVFSGSSTPAAAIAGDIWFRDLG